MVQFRWAWPEITTKTQSQETDSQRMQFRLSLSMYFQEGYIYIFNYFAWFLPTYFTSRVGNLRSISFNRFRGNDKCCLWKTSADFSKVIRMFWNYPKFNFQQEERRQFVVRVQGQLIYCCNPKFRVSAWWWTLLIKITC